MRIAGNKRSFVTVAVCLLIIAVLGCASVPEPLDSTGKKGYEEVTRHLNTYIAKSMKKNKVTGLSIALVDDQEIIFARGFGYADRENKVPATKNTVYRAGSISKLFTAAAVMQLAQTGKVDIDAPFDTYVPGFSIRSRFADAGEITPRNIMTHHSGLPSDYIRGMYTTKPELLEQFLPRLKEEYTAFPPDLVFSYSNLGVGILGPLIEKVSKKGYADYMNEEVLVPLGMNNSSFVRQFDSEALIAKGYYKKKEQEQYALRDMPAGSLYSNVLDLSRFMQMVFAGGRSGGRQILAPGSLDEMLTVQNPACVLDMDVKVGLGWMIMEKQGAGTIIGQGGGTGTYFSTMFAVREHKLAAIVLTNCVEGSAVTGEICMKALNSLYEAKTGGTVPDKDNRPAKTALSEDEMKRYEGHFDTEMGFVNISVEGKKLVWHSRDGLFLLTPRQDGSFTVKYLFFGFIPIKVSPFDELAIAFDDIAGYRVVAGIRDNTRVLMGTRIEPVAVPVEWHTRLGRYDNAGHGQDGIYVKSIEISMRDGFLLADVVFTDLEDDTMTLALMPINDTQAIVMGLGRNRGYTYTFSARDDSKMLHAYGYDFLPGQPDQE
jgi:CubicO group peptidase (beta-lactamase class C family)